MKFIRLDDGSVVDVEAPAQNEGVGTFYGNRAFVCESVSDDKYGKLILAAPELYGEAQTLRCLATSPRLQSMTVAEALAELKLNGCGHDDGAALAKARGEVRS